MIEAIASAAFLVLAQQIVTEPVPRADYLSVMDAQYAALDADGNGAVTPEEIAQQQNAVAQQQVAAANRQIFANLDKDGDGTLTPQEFLQLAARPQPIDPAPTMQRLDLNRDGTVSLVEHRTVMLATFDSLDADKDGVVTPVETQAAQQAREQAAQQAPAPAQGR